MKLTPNQVAFFRHNGYFLLTETVPEPLLNSVRSLALDHFKNEVKPYRTQSGHITRIDQLWDRDPLFRELILHPVLLEPLQSLLGPNIEFQRLRHNHATFNRRGDNKEGWGGMGYHRDSLQWSRPIITAVIYCDESTVERGATCVIPGSHFLPYVQMPPGGRGGNWLSDHVGYEDLRFQSLPVPAPKGGILLFDSLLFHTAGVNRTDESRISIALGYRSVDELSLNGQEQCELVCGERVYRGNDADVRTGNWLGDVVDV